MPAQPLIISGSVTAKAPMSRIDRYILSQFLTLFGFFALVLVSVYWINRAVSLFEQLISDGQTALVVLEFTALTLPLVISVVLPIAAFAASAYGITQFAVLRPGDRYGQTMGDAVAGAVSRLGGQVTATGVYAPQDPSGWEATVAEVAEYIQPHP